MTQLKWLALKLLMRTLGRASDGVDLGYRYGFDSGKMLDYVYENRARGRLLYGALVDRIYLDAIGWRAIRERKMLLKSLLIQEVEKDLGAGKETVLLDVASGPGRYLQEMAMELGRPASLTVLCRDLDEAGQAQGRAQAQAAGLPNFRFEVGDACDRGSLADVSPRPSIVVASGLYELLDSGLVRRSMRAIYPIMEDGGRFVFTTQVRHPQLELIANVLPNRFGQPWVMECRPVEAVEGWALEAGFRDPLSREEPLGLFAVTVAQK